MRPPAVERIVIAGPAGDLQGVIEDPRDALAPAPRAFAVLCHPHPLHGGTMDNKVVTTLARSLHELAMPTIRFNFRGVGESAGAFDEGRGETDDALAAVAIGRQRWPDAALWLGGFSFGGLVALRAATSPGGDTLARLITIAPAFTRYYDSPAAVPVPRCPWLLIQGDADEVIAAADVIAWARALSPAPTLIAMPGVGHFFHGHLNALREAILGNVR